MLWLQITSFHPPTPLLPQDYFVAVGRHLTTTVLSSLPGELQSLVSACTWHRVGQSVYEVHEQGGWLAIPQIAVVASGRGSGELNREKGMRNAGNGHTWPGMTVRVQTQRA